MFARAAIRRTLRILALCLAPAAAARAQGATFTGTVMDSTRTPIAAADVALTDLGTTVVTDERGTFRMTDIPAGAHRVFVRKIGYGASDTTVSFKNGEVVERRVVLGHASALEAVTVRGNAPRDFAMESFEEHRRLGLGQSMTRAEIATLDGMHLGTLIEQMRGVAVRPGHAGQAWVASSRRAGMTLIRPDDSDLRMGAPVTACYAQVYLDNAMVFSGRHHTDGGIEKWDPLFDINSIAPEQVDAIEYYSGPAQTPLKYSRMESHCGVLVIWTRRYHPDSTVSSGRPPRR